MLTFFFFTVLVLGLSTAEKPPVDPCAKDDHECLRRNVQEYLHKGAGGNPAENIASLDPFTIDKLELDTPDAHYTLSNNKITGFKDVEVLKFERSASDQGKGVTTMELALKLAVDSDVETVYHLKPECVTLKGKLTRHIDTVVTIAYPSELVDGKDGEKYFKAGKETTTFELKKPTTYSAEKEVSDAYNANAEFKAIDHKNAELPEFKNKIETEIINHLAATYMNNLRHIQELHPAKEFLKL